MRCNCCNVILNTQESVRKFQTSGDYVDMCNKCLNTIDDDVQYDEGFGEEVDDDEELTQEKIIAKFIKHTNCPSCGSRDNLGVYSDDSSYCFGCGFTERGTANPWDAPVLSTDPYDVEEVCILPTDTSTSFGEEALQYLEKSKVSILTAIERGLRYSVSNEQLLFPYYNAEGKLACLQARNFNKYRREKAKYYNKGSPSEVLPIYLRDSTRRSRCLVITEDALSAIRIASQCDAMPALGTYVPVKKIVALAASYEFIIVWLDHDKWREARDIADNCKWLGLSARTVFTELDPKAYTNEEITEYLQI